MSKLQNAIGGTGSATYEGRESKRLFGTKSTRVVVRVLGNAIG